MRAQRPEITARTIESYLHNLYRAQPDFVYSVSRDFARSCPTPILVLPDDAPSHPTRHPWTLSRWRHTPKLLPSPGQTNPKR